MVDYRSFSGVAVAASVRAVAAIMAMPARRVRKVKAGLQLVELLRGAVPALVDPGTTAVWEMRLDDVTVGKANFRAIIDEIAGEADRLIRVLQQHSAASSTWASLSAPKAGGPGSGAGHSMSGGELPSPLASTPQLPLAPCVLIEETAADVEIFVIAGWQAGQFVLGKPLREGDQSGSRSPPSTDSAGWGIPNEVRQAMLTIAI